MHALALALNWAASLGYAELLGYAERPAEVDRLASELVELSTRHNFVYWLALGAIHRGWARSASGDIAEGITSIEHGIGNFRATGSVLALPGYLARKAEALQNGQLFATPQTQILGGSVFHGNSRARSCLLDAR